MKKIFFLLLILLVLCQFSIAQKKLKKGENVSVYLGTTGNSAGNAQLAGVSLGGNIWHFLQLQVDFFKYIKRDQNLYSADPTLDRSDFTGISGNLVLKIPIHFIPYLDKLEFINPYILVGYGYGLENFTSEFHNLPDKEGNTGPFSKTRKYESLGAGVIIWVLPTIGIKLDYRSIEMPMHTGMDFPARRFNRVCLGICF